MHACGVIICRDDITDWVPVSTAQDKNGDRILVTQYEGSVIESTGLMLGHVVEHILAAVVVEVDVDVGERYAVGVEEAFEQEFGTEEEYRSRITEEELFAEFTGDEHGNTVLSREAAEKKIKALGGVLSPGSMPLRSRQRTHAPGRCSLPWPVPGV